jgi:hypothetical protein
MLERSLKTYHSAYTTHSWAFLWHIVVSTTMWFRPPFTVSSILWRTVCWKYTNKISSLAIIFISFGWMFSHLFTRDKSDIGKEVLGHTTSLTPPRFIDENKVWTVMKRYEKKSSGKKCMIFVYLSQVVNFIILNPFKVVKLKSCFILICSILVLWYGLQINAPSYTKSNHLPC